MCFELDSDPPIARIAGAAVSHDDLVLEAADGNSFAAFEATPDEPNGIGVVILPDVRGLYRFYEELALRFAERGYLAIAIDWFGRTAGVGKRGEEFEYPEHTAQTTQQGIQADIAAAVSTFARGRERSSRSASASAVATPGSRLRAGTASPGRSASTECPAIAATASQGRSTAQRRWRRRSSRSRPAPTSTSPRS